LTNKISSADLAIEALMKLRSKSVPVRVAFACPYTEFSFEGYIEEVGGFALKVRGKPNDAVEEREQRLPELVISFLRESSFDGDLEEDDFRLRLRLLITRPISVGGVDLYRFFIEGKWQLNPPKHSRPN
jgi:hypothetical protein